MPLKLLFFFYTLLYVINKTLTNTNNYNKNMIREFMNIGKNYYRSFKNCIFDDFLSTNPEYDGYNKFIFRYNYIMENIVSYSFGFFNNYTRAVQITNNNI